MKKLFPAFILLACLASCRDRSKNSERIDADFYDTSGTVVREAYSGMALTLRSETFKGLKPEDIRLKKIKVEIEGIEAPILKLYNGNIVTQVPVISSSIAKDLKITVSIADAARDLGKKLQYRPTITATPFAGVGSDGKPNGIFSYPAELVMDSKGNLYVVDQNANGHDRIVKVTPDGKASVFIGGDGSLGRIVGIGVSPLDTALYFSDATAQQVKKIQLSGTPAVSVVAGTGKTGNDDGKGSQVSFNFGNQMVKDFGSNELGQGMAVDKDGNIYVGERYGSFYSGRSSSVRKITSDGTVTTVPGSVRGETKGPEDVQSPAGITLNDAKEVVYIGGASSWFQGMVRVTPGGMIRLAGRFSHEEFFDGKGEVATFCFPKSLQFADGFYWVADGESSAIRRVDKDGNVVTIAGGGHGSNSSQCVCPEYKTPKETSTLYPSSSDKSPDAFKNAAKAIHIDLPGGIAVKDRGLMYFSDYGQNYRCIWKLTIK